MSAAASTTARGWEPSRLAPGLWRWNAEHPEWRSGALRDSPGDWERHVGSVACELDAALVFIDALVPADADRFWRWADARAAAAERVLALSTIGFHRRDRERLAERYGASTSRARKNLPEGLEAIPLRGAGEVVFWIPDRASLVCGDRILGADGGRLRLCPASWLRYLESDLSIDGLRELLRPLLELPVERVLVAHGEPVLAGGREALARAIG
jgi:glyoxylase-like metal-dependent hydrolase (beta-lactamase superfamily II)